MPSLVQPRLRSAPPFALHFLTALLVVLILAGSSPARGNSGFTLQHGARATAQAGALTARADDASAVAYNPAGLARSQGLGFLLALEQPSSSARYTATVPSPFGGSERVGFRASTAEDLVPSLYLSWRDPGTARAAGSRWAFGIGLDSAMDRSVDWRDDDFPAAGQLRRTDIELLDLHPVAAIRLSESWSAGLGVHYYFGDLHDANRNLLAVGRNPGTFFVYGERSSEAEVHGTALDVSLQFQSEDRWGFGAAARSGAKLDGAARNNVREVSGVPPGFEQTVADAIDILEEVPASLAFELPAQIRIGVWRRLHPDLVLELDAAFDSWSQTASGFTRYRPGCGEPANCPAEFRRDLQDTLAFAAAAEWQATQSVAISSGIGWEPSPSAGGSLRYDFGETVRADRGDPGFPEGDAWIAGLGVSFGFASGALDLGYSKSFLEDRVDLAGGETSTRASRLAASVRWRL